MSSNRRTAQMNRMDKWNRHKRCSDNLPGWWRRYATLQLGLSRRGISRIIECSSRACQDVPSWASHAVHLAILLVPRLIQKFVFAKNPRSSVSLTPLKLTRVLATNRRLVADGGYPGAAVTAPAHLVQVNLEPAHPGAHTIVVIKLFIAISETGIHSTKDDVRDEKDEGDKSRQVWSDSVMLRRGRGGRGTWLLRLSPEYLLNTVYGYLFLISNRYSWKEIDEVNTFDTQRQYTRSVLVFWGATPWPEAQLIPLRNLPAHNAMGVAHEQVFTSSPLQQLIHTKPRIPTRLMLTGLGGYFGVLFGTSM